MNIVCSVCGKRYSIKSTSIFNISQSRFSCTKCNASIVITKKDFEGESLSGERVFSKGIFGGLSIKFKLILPFFILIVTAMVVTGYISVVANTEMADEYALNLLDQTSTRILAKIGSYLEKPQLINAGNANMMRDEFLDGARKEDLLQYFYNQGKIFPGLGTIAFATPRGEFYGANAPEHYIVIADKELTEGAIRRYAPDRHGYRSSKILRSKEGYNATTRGWFKAAAAAKRPTWTEIEASATGQRLDCSAVYPYMVNNVFKGVFLVDVSLQAITRYLKGQTISKNGQAFIMEPSGQIVAGSTIDKPFVIKGSTVERLKADDAKYPAMQTVYAQLTEEGVNFSQLQQAEQRKIKINGKSWMLQITPFNDNYIKWLIMVMAPESDFSLTEKIRNIIMSVWSVILLLVVLISWVISNQIAKPIKEIARIGNLISVGKRKLELLPENRKDEIGDLIKSFNRLVSSLKLAMQKMRSR